jgi:chromosome segregation ATPase
MRLRAKSRAFIDGSRSRGVSWRQYSELFLMLPNFMDPVIAAQVRLEQAVSRLEEALAQRGAANESAPEEFASVSAELERVRAENAELMAVKRTATERLDMAIKQVKGLIGG